ncbi:MAG: sterol desaturase family protein [Wenzhouxiangellaceae bacterium]|nr:sterol desaturase family protein [Wenzhouxiangellaceae bacterium]
MSDWVALEGVLRPAAFVAVLVLLLVLQTRFAVRGDGWPARRQAINLALVLIDTALLRLAFPLLAVALAVDVHAAGGGLFGRFAAPAWIEIMVAVLLLDLAIYWQHRLMHTLPWLWRLHRVHHCDPGFDVTTALRFHPLEIALSMAIKLALVLLLGPHPAAVLAFELLLSLGALWTHADLALPARLDRALRYVLVTPSMHRIHHSTWRPETDSNYGFHLSLWDRMFASYRALPRRPESVMPIGLDAFSAPREQRLGALLLNPFRSSERG